MSHELPFWKSGLAWYAIVLLCVLRWDSRGESLSVETLSFLQSWAAKTENLNFITSVREWEGNFCNK